MNFSFFLLGFLFSHARLRSRFQNIQNSKYVRYRVPRYCVTPRARCALISFVAPPRAAFISPRRAACIHFALPVPARPSRPSIPTRPGPVPPRSVVAPASLLFCSLWACLGASGVVSFASRLFLETAAPVSFHRREPIVLRSWLLRLVCGGSVPRLRCDRRVLHLCDCWRCCC